MGETEIYYFTGTGNSLHIARELQKRLPEVILIPVISLIHKDKIQINAESVGFVFPLHGMSMPIPVKSFLKKVNLNPAKYLFAVATRGGTKCMAFKQINRMLKRQGKALNAHFVVNMASNDPKFDFYKVPTQEELTEIEAKIQLQLNDIAGTILMKENSIEPDKDFIASGFLLDKLVLLGMKYAEINGAKNYFYSDSKCTGCGMCERVCTARKVRMVGDKPVWQNDVKCNLCYACINYCTAQAAQIKTKVYMKSYTDKNARYPHPYATAKDIENQKF
ncbi:MAG: EFR1 family ferrodoxin [Bacillota bacterium]